MVICSDEDNTPVLTDTKWGCVKLDRKIEAKIAALKRNLMVDSIMLYLRNLILTGCNLLSRSS